MAIHQPKGGMCAGCKNLRGDCSKLPFYSMPVLAKDNLTGAIIVRCTSYNKVIGD